ncbi:atherin-like [Symphalangus syndactylus]|uniref:atherin-like n=1 Tax=Symphalangus syndactylus TaxID=9590 RepID=UPI00300405E3
MVQRETEKQQLMANPLRRLHAPSAAVSCCFSTLDCPLEKSLRPSRGERSRGRARARSGRTDRERRRGGLRAAATRKPADGSTEWAVPEPSPERAPAPAPAGRASQPARLLGGGEAGKQLKPHPPPCPQPRHSQAPRDSAGPPGSLGGDRLCSCAAVPAWAAGNRAGDVNKEIGVGRERNL